MQVWVLNDEQYVLLMLMHHVYTDGWSTGLLQRELAMAYAAVLAGRQPAWAPLPVQYQDVAVWQRTHIEGEMLDAQIAWWKQTLAGAPPLLELPWDFPRPAVASPVGVSAAVQLDAAMTTALRQLAAAQQTTVFVVLLAAVQVFLALTTGQDDIVVGTPYAGRSQSEVQHLAGCLVNTLALRADVSGDPTFQQLLQRVKTVSAQAFQHADAPFAKVVEALRVDRSANFNPVYQVRHPNVGFRGCCPACQK